MTLQNMNNVNLIIILVLIILVFAGVGIFYLFDSEYKQDEAKTCDELRDVILGNSSDWLVSHYSKIFGLYQIKCDSYKSTEK